MYTRKGEIVLREMLNEFRILYLTGPRQAGKTTLARKIADDTKMQYVSLDDQTAFASAQYDPHGFIDSFKNRPVVLDEFQYAPELIKAIKLASDLLPENKRGQFFLTGSADILNLPEHRKHCQGIWLEWNCIHCLSLKKQIAILI